MFSIRTQRDADELNSLIADLQDEGIRIKSFLKDRYRLDTIEDALEWLTKLHAGVIEWLYKMSESIA